MRDHSNSIYSAHIHRDSPRLDRQALDHGSVPPRLPIPLLLSLSLDDSHTQLPAQHGSIATKGEVNLQGVGEQLVHLGKLGGDAEVNCPVANLNNEPTDDIGVDLERC